MWRERLRVKESNAEIQLFTALQTNGLTTDLMYQHPIYLSATIPDFCYPTKKIAIYLDGPPHLKPHQEAKDEHINEQLKKRGWKVLRFDYNRFPIPKHELTIILEKIKEEM